MRISAAAKGCSPQNAEFHALPMHPPISNSLTGIPSGSKPLPSSHFPLLNCFSTQHLGFTGSPSLPSTPPIAPPQTPPNPTNHSELHDRVAARNTQPRLREILLGSKRFPKGLGFLLLVATGAGCIPCGLQRWDGHILLLLWGRCEGDGDPTEPLEPHGLSPSPRMMRNPSTGALGSEGMRQGLPSHQHTPINHTPIFPLPQGHWLRCLPIPEPVFSAAYLKLGNAQELQAREAVRQELPALAGFFF